MMTGNSSSSRDPAQHIPLCSTPRRMVTFVIFSVACDTKDARRFRPLSFRKRKRTGLRGEARRIWRIGPSSLNPLRSKSPGRAGGGRQWECRLSPLPAAIRGGFAEMGRKRCPHAGAVGLARSAVEAVARKASLYPPYRSGPEHPAHPDQPAP